MMTDFENFYDEATDSFVFDGKKFDSIDDITRYRQGHVEEPPVQVVEEVEVAPGLFILVPVKGSEESAEVSEVSPSRVSEVSSPLEVSQKRFELYTTGVSISEIARREGVSRGAVQKSIRKMKAKAGV